jgi:phage anti-repressor protein
MLTPITITNHPQLGPSVSGRELYRLIAESKASRNIFSDWFKDRQDKLTLKEGIDFIRTSVVLPETGSNRKQIEYIISIAAAKRMAPMQTKNRGAGVLAYLEAYEMNPGIVDQVNKDTPQQVPISSLPVAQPVGNPLLPFGTQSEPVPVETPQPAEPLTPAQELLRKAQQLVDEENRIREQQAEAAEKAKQAPPVESLGQIEARLHSAEQKVNTLLTFFTQTYQALQELNPVENGAATEDTTAPTTRGLLARLVNSYASATRGTEHETWKYLYGQFDLRNGFNVYAHAPGKGERNYLSVIERYGQVENLYVLARKLFVLPELK